MPTDCKAWQTLGIKQSGVYPIKPDNGPAFQVMNNCTIIRHYTDRFTVIWRLMVVDGLYFRGDKMALLISTSTGQTMRMGLVILLESFG